MPIALMCATYADSWEKAVEFSALIGGDTDTIAAMAGAVAEARFGLPLTVVNGYSRYVPAEVQVVVREFYGRLGGVQLENEPVSAVPQQRRPRLARRLVKWLLGC